jgi:hypothetical protein
MANIRSQIDIAGWLTEERPVRPRCLGAGRKPITGSRPVAEPPDLFDLALVDIDINR